MNCETPFKAEIAEIERRQALLESAHQQNMTRQVSLEEEKRALEATIQSEQAEAHRRWMEEHDRMVKGICNIHTLGIPS